LKQQLAEQRLERNGTNGDFSSIQHAPPPQSPNTVAEDPRIGQPKRCLIIGGGPAGLISLHEFVNPVNRTSDESSEARHVELYERRVEVGGIWYFEHDNDIAKGWQPGSKRDGVNSASSTSAQVSPDNGSYTSTVTNAKHHGEVYTQADALKAGLSLPTTSPSQTSRWVSPAYHGLVGNVLPPLLEFSALPIKQPALGLFPSMTETQQYLIELAKPLRQYIKTRREVTNVEPVFVNGRIQEPAKWSVTSVDWSTNDKGVETTEEWDTIIVAPGINEHPFYPQGVTGLNELVDAKSSLVMHAKTYSGPLPFVNQHNRIAVVGNGNSANDIAAHLAPLNSEGPLYRCARHEGRFAHLEDDRIVDVPALFSITTSADESTATLTLTDGQVVTDITKVIFATGYQFDFPWIRAPPSTLHNNIPDLSQISQSDLEPVSKYGAVPFIHEQTFLAVAPTLCFVGLPTCSIPLPLAEIQARIAARVYHNTLALPAHDAAGLLTGFYKKRKELGLSDDDGTNWRLLHFKRGAEERRHTSYLLDWLEKGQQGASTGLFRWDERRETIAKGMRGVKEGELRRLRDLRVAAGGVAGGPGGVLAVGYDV